MPLTKETEAFAERVRALLREKNVAELSRETGLSRQALYGMAEGADPRLSHVVRIAAAVGLSIEELVGSPEKVAASD